MGDLVTGAAKINTSRETELNTRTRALERRIGKALGIRYAQSQVQMLAYGAILKPTGFRRQISLLRMLTIESIRGGADGYKLERTVTTQDNRIKTIRH